jgi:hypothetical protein
LTATKDKPAPADTTGPDTAPARPSVTELLERHGHWGCPRTVYDLLEDYPQWDPEVLLGSRHHDDAGASVFEANLEAIAGVADAAMTLLGDEFDAVWHEAQQALIVSNQGAHGRLNAYLQCGDETAATGAGSLVPQPALAGETEPEPDGAEKAADERQHASAEALKVWAHGETLADEKADEAVENLLDIHDTDPAGETAVLDLPGEEE